MRNLSVIKTVAMLDSAIARNTQKKADSRFQLNSLTSQLANVTVDNTDYDGEIQKYNEQVIAFTNLRQQTPPGSKADQLDEMIAEAADLKQKAENRKEANSISNLERKSLDQAFCTDDLVKFDAYLVELEALRPTLPSA